MNLLIWQDGSLVDPRIRVNCQVISIFTDLEKKGMFASTKGIAIIIIKGEYLLKMSINKREVKEYVRSIELIKIYFLRNII